MTPLRARRAGVTLIELMAVLAVVGIAALAVSFRIAPREKDGTSQWRAIDEVRRQVLRTGRDSTFVVGEGGQVVVVTVYADGAVRRSGVKAK